MQNIGTERSTERKKGQGRVGNWQESREVGKKNDEK